jgi:hypothetical protein
MYRSLLLLILPFMAACDVHSKNPAKGDEDVSIKADESGQIAFNLPIAEGKLKVPAGMMHNSNLDIDGVKLMPGSSVTGLNVDAHSHDSTVDIAFASPASPEQVRSYFVDQFKDKGVVASLSGNSVTGTSKDGSQFTIAVDPAEKGSKGRIVIHSKD